MGHGAAADSAQLANAVLETERGVPFVSRADQKSLPHGSIEYAACAFLIAQGPFCYFGASTGWLDPDWAWHGEYDWRVGAPLRPARRESQYRWSRDFENANVTVDTRGARCSLATW